MHKAPSPFKCKSIRDAGLDATGVIKGRLKQVGCEMFSERSQVGGAKIKWREFKIIGAAIRNDQKPKKTKFNKLLFLLNYSYDKKLSYHRGTAQRDMLIN